MQRLFSKSEQRKMCTSDWLVDMLLPWSKFVLFCIYFQNEKGENTGVNVPQLQQHNRDISEDKNISHVIFFFSEHPPYFCTNQSNHNHMKALTITPNLFIIGTNVISYNTTVARIEGDKLIENGRYSRTTSKHIQHVARLFNLEVIPAGPKDRPRFFKYELGVRVQMPKNALSMKTSKAIVDFMKEGLDFLNSVVKLPKIPKKDMEIIINHLEENGISESQFKIYRRTQQRIDFNY